jgi:FdhD protein
MLSNVVRVELAPNVVFDMERLERHFYTSSSCGVCGKSSLEALAVAGMTPLASSFSLSPELLCLLPNRLRAAQEVFEQTGGLHASALFSCAGELLALREDVGRHNALDKLIGSAWEAGELPLSKEILLLSGRVSFELMQKAIRAGISVVAAVGAPSSLAVDMAEQFGVLLVGFVREDRLNVYAGAERLSLPS